MSTVILAVTAGDSPEAAGDPFPSYFRSAPNSGGQVRTTMKHMTDVGIRALKQNASAVVARAAAGETVTITDRGRPVAQLTPIPISPLQQLVDTGRARAARRSIVDLPAREDRPSLSHELAIMRDAERY